MLKNIAMTTKEKFEQLKEREINAKSNVERTQIDAELELLADKNPVEFEAIVMESARKTLADAKALKLKEQLAQISDIISMTYIAKTYFNKSKSWISQRINELDVNGKPVKFMPEEIDKLNFAFKDISKKLNTFRVS